MVTPAAILKTVCIVMMRFLHPASVEIRIICNFSDVVCPQIRNSHGASAFFNGCKHSL
jgi:hypothetical protein